MVKWQLNVLDPTAFDLPEEKRPKSMRFCALNIEGYELNAKS